MEMQQGEVKMVGILMNASVQITNEKEFEELQKRMTIPNTAVNIKETIQNRINPKNSIMKKNNVLLILKDYESAITS